MEIQNIMEALDLGVLFNEMDKLVNNFESSSSDEDNLDESPMRQTYCSLDPNKPSKSRDWIKEIIANDQTDSEDSDFEDIQFYLRFHQTCNKYADETKIDPDLFKYMHYSTDIVTGESKYKNNQTELRKPKAKSKKGFSAIKEEPGVDEDLLDGDRRSFYKSGISDKRKLGSSKKANVDTIRKRLWKSIAKKDIPKAYRQKSQNRAIKGMLLKKLIKEACKRLRVKAIESRQKCRSEAIVSRARRMTREAQVFWKKYSKVEKSQRKRAEKQALVQRKLDEEIREAQRQRRKLNYLITQTELYAHFMCGKLKKTLTDEATKDESDILNQLDEPQFGSNDEYTKESALENAQAAYEVHQQSTNEFIADKDLTDFTNFQQPTKLVGKLTGYQLTGVNWLAGLYAHGLNGILADDMGLGKTIQTIAFLAHLSERIGIWGPFLVVAPASTLNNWHQEFARFLPSFKVLPYWGNVNERKILRLFWNQKESSSGTTSAPFHVLVTSYQLVISDVRYFQRIKWQYMVLDEAHALKSTSSIRWKTLLDFNCRNRLLLTGTPIQNTMAELWALLHFIMPTLFDNHGEFNEWFSKDIEYHAENKSNIDEKHLSRLHMILKPFMLRRLKSEVEHELTDKIEVRVMCQLAPRQRRLYDSLQKNITLQELLKKTTSVVPSNASGNVLMNLVMQFRKMCNHPDLFDSHDVHSSFLLSAATYRLPALLYHEIFTDLLSPSRRKILYSDFSVHSPSHVHRSLTSIDGEEQSCFSFMRLMNLSVAEYAMNFTKSATTRFDHCRETRRKTKARLRAHFWGLDAPEKFTDTFPHFVSNQLSSNKKQPLCEANREPTINGGLTLLLPTFVDRFKAASSRSVFSSFVFCRRRYEPFFFAHVNCDVTSLSQSDRSGGPPATGKRRNTGAQELVINLKNQSLDDMFQQRVVADQLTCQPLSAPKLIKDVAKAKVYCYVPEIYCNERSAAHKLQQANSLMRGNCFENFNPISIPDRERLVSDSGKLLALDMLLRRLKDGGHRVLIYSQMTKMIDLLEEYMVLRRHTYVRLDGSSRISSRRDTVAGFQARNDIFVFLLSTRAGGLGINLTAADTVIFFDSDWNPTVDQQAMDRAHRLGQTKQVTVYRLVCQGTVDERVLQRAEEKSAIQNMVISGGSFKADSLKPKEVVSLLLDDQQMAREFNEMGDTPGRKFVIGGRRGKKRGRKSNREKEMERAKRLRELDGGSTSPAPEPSAFLGPTASTVMRISGSGQPSREASPAPSSFADSNTPSELSCDGDSRGAEDEPLIVVDELPPFDSPPAPDVRRGRRGRGRPRIRPLVPRKSHFMTRTTTSRSRASRSRGGRRAGRKAFSGRAAAMAGARAGMAAASAAAFAAYGYNLPNSSGGS